MKFTLIKSFPNGHRYFHSDQPGDEKIYVADQSGLSPASTEDGIMWIDFERDINVNWRHAALPVTLANQKKKTTPLGIDEMLWISRHYEQRINDGTTKYTVT